VIILIYWDIDGVIRRLDLAAYGHEVDSWAAKNKIGLTLLDIINNDPSLCRIAPPSEYLPFVNTLPKLVFLSNQLKDWQSYTDDWLEMHITTEYEVIYTNNDKFDYMKEDDFLVDDYPFFENYDRVILVDRLYNRCSLTKVRVRTPFELEEVLRCVG
jgi:hypothetical protein